MTIRENVQELISMVEKGKFPQAIGKYYAEGASHAQETINRHASDFRH